VFICEIFDRLPPTTKFLFGDKGRSMPDRKPLEIIKCR